MRELSAEARLHLYARSLNKRAGNGFHAAALYGAFALIAADRVRHAVGSSVLSYLTGSVPPAGAMSMVCP